MAKMEIKMPDDLLSKISKLGDKTDEVTKAALKAGADKALPYFQESLHNVIGTDLKSHKGKSRSTGELESSLGVSPAKIDREGNANIKIGFNEPRRVQRAAKGKRSYYTATNAMLANALEYGKHGQPPKPFFKPAANRAKRAARAEIIRKFEEEIEKL